MRALFGLRLRTSLLLLGGACLYAPAAEASSFVSIEAPKAKVSSSFVVLGAPAAAPPQAAAAQPERKTRSQLDASPDYAWDAAPLRISASIIALGTPAVEEVKVASIGTPAAPEKPRPRPNAQPKVIRAGVQGHAFPQYVAPVQAVAQTPAAKPEPQAASQKPARQRPDPAPAKPETPAAPPTPAFAKPE